MKKHIILCDCVSDEVESLCDALSSSDKKFEICSHIANWKRTGKMSELRRYGKYFAVALKYFMGRKKYDTIIGWQQFYVLIFCFFCSVFHVKKQNKLIALNFTYKEKNGKAKKIYRWFMGKCLETGYIDYLCVLSQNYAKIISEEFNLPLEKIIILPFGINDPYENFSKLAAPSEAPENGYVLAIGRSNRDYDFLISAWEKIEYPLVIIADTYKGSNRGNPNVHILRNVAGEASYPWIANCDAMVLPIDDGTICSGDTVLLTALAMKKKVLITAPSTLSEMYIVDFQNGLCVEKDKSKFEVLVKEMLFSDKYDYLQDNARESYLTNYSRMSMGKRIKEKI
ncbi:MAG: glycosyltransferase family 4 protein [Ruminococcaceae bacterium]|nr:glycosyltransferase family 4 protein [Oscillospiraceae bacterium]